MERGQLKGSGVQSGRRRGILRRRLDSSWCWCLRWPHGRRRSPCTREPPQTLGRMTGSHEVPSSWGGEKLLRPASPPDEHKQVTSQWLRKVARRGSVWQPTDLFDAIGHAAVGNEVHVVENKLHLKGTADQVDHPGNRRMDVSELGLSASSSCLDDAEYQINSGSDGDNLDEASAPDTRNCSFASLDGDDIGNESMEALLFEKVRVEPTGNSISSLSMTLRPRGPARSTVFPLIQKVWFARKVEGKKADAVLVELLLPQDRPLSQLILDVLAKLKLQLPNGVDPCKDVVWQVSEDEHRPVPERGLGALPARTLVSDFADEPLIAVVPWPAPGSEATIGVRRERLENIVVTVQLDPRDVRRVVLAADMIVHDILPYIVERFHLEDPSSLVCHILDPNPRTLRNGQQIPTVANIGLRAVSIDRVGSAPGAPISRRRSESVEGGTEGMHSDNEATPTSSGNKRHSEVFFFNEVTARKYTEYDVIKINKYGKRQKRILGIDGEKIYNRLPQEGAKGQYLPSVVSWRHASVKTPERLLDHVVTAQVHSTNPTQFLIVFEVPGTSKREVQPYEVATTSMCAEIVAKLRFLVSSKRQAVPEYFIDINETGKHDEVQNLPSEGSAYHGKTRLN